MSNPLAQLGAAVDAVLDRHVARTVRTHPDQADDVRDAFAPQVWEGSVVIHPDPTVPFGTVLFTEEIIP